MNQPPAPRGLSTPLGLKTAVLIVRCPDYRDVKMNRNDQFVTEHLCPY
jgi:hypothetical protein